MGEGETPPMFGGAIIVVGRNPISRRDGSGQGAAFYVNSSFHRWDPQAVFRTAAGAGELFLHSVRRSIVEGGNEPRDEHSSPFEMAATKSECIKSR